MGRGLCVVFKNYNCGNSYKKNKSSWESTDEQSSTLAEVLVYVSQEAFFLPEVKYLTLSIFSVWASYELALMTSEIHF